MVSRRCAIALSALLLLAAPGRGQSGSAPCTTVAACIAQLRSDKSEETEAARAELVRLGDPAVEALLPLAQSSDSSIRYRAARALVQFDRIDPRHYPALLAAWNAGNRWVAEAIVATGSEAGFQLLLAQPLIENPGMNTNEPVQKALARYGDRLRPWATAEFDQCRRRWNLRCQGLLGVLGQMRPVPAWALTLQADGLASGKIEGSARHWIERNLVAAKHPAGLAALAKGLEHALADKREGFDDKYALRDVGTFGPAGASAGPLVTQFLHRSDRPDGRAEAALTVGLIGYRPALADLARMGDAMIDDYLLAYNAVDSIGMLGGAELRPLVERIARDHWHPAARAGAERTLARLDGRPVEADPPPKLNYAGDPFRSAPPHRYPSDRKPVWCSTAVWERAAEFEDRIVPPAAGSSWLRRAALDPKLKAKIDRRYGSENVRSDIATYLQWKDGWILGFDAGEWGGSFLYERGGKKRSLSGENAIAVFIWGDRLYLLTGLNHMGLNRGDLWELDRETVTPIRRVRLPGTAYRFAVSSKGALLFPTEGGTLALTLDGRLADPAPYSDCPANETAQVSAAP